MRPTIFLRAILLLLIASRVPAQQHAHPASGSEKLGTVHFETSCAPAAAPQFDRAMALLHSFEFAATIRALDGVLATDSTCAMAHWGIALSRWGNPMSPGNRPAAALEQGLRAATAAARLAERGTEREKGYANAVRTLFADYQRLDQRTRVVAYEKAMADLASRHPADTEAQIFHAISLVGAAAPTDKSYANQRAAGATLEAIWASQPDHPGLAHYIIHSYDVPALAEKAAAAARRYADIAPSAAHALHMPSHTFTRVGMWKESVKTNLRSYDVAAGDGSLAEALHAWDYATYAYLQMRKDSAAKAIVEGLPPVAARFDPNAVTGAAPGSAGVFALAAIPARYALERREWAEAAALTPKASAYPYAEAMTYFTRALGAARLGNRELARESIDSLASIRDRLVAAKEPYWAEQVAIQHLGANAWLALAEGNRDSALARMREAVAREGATEKAAVTPGPLVPARELLGDMLMELKQPAEALAEYRQSLVREPNRFRSLYGAMSAAAAAGDGEEKAKYAAELATLTGVKTADWK